MEAMELDEASLCSTETIIINTDEYSNHDLTSSSDTCPFSLSVVKMPEEDSVSGPSSFENLQFMTEDHPNFINLNAGMEESANENIFNRNGTLKIVGYGTPVEKHSTAEIPITTPKKVSFASNAAPRLGVVSSSPLPGFSGALLTQIKEENEEDPMQSPLYPKIKMEQENYASRKRSSKIPQAIPLQKVSKRRHPEADTATCYLEEPDGEVVVLMNGILTKVGKPIAPTSSGKIYSTAQNCPITVKWLLENFESMVGQSLPRSFVYDQYVAHCKLNKIDSVNAASFGKLIRSVFLGLRTRRLGTRGNSKYHYYGIKIKETSHLLPILNSIRAEQDLLNDTVNGRIRKRVRRTQSVYTGKHVKGLVIDKKIEIQENFGSLEYHYPDIFISKEIKLPEDFDPMSLEMFEDTYKRHCLKLVGFFHDFKLIDVLAEIANFWRLTLSFKRKGLEDYSLTLSKPLLFKLVSFEEVNVFVTRMDLYMFQHVINILIPSVLRPAPLQVLQAVDNMIQDILGLVSIAMKGYPLRIAHSKIRVLTAFVRVWKQYAKMSQLSEFVELTLENELHVLAMRQDINSIDMENICDRAAMIVESSNMGYSEILRMMKSFARNLDKDQSLELWCNWAYTEILKVIPRGAAAAVEDVELVTADMHSCWLILSNLVVNAIREIFGADSSLFVPLLQWCGELMQYFRQRLLDQMNKVMPITRFYNALMDIDMSVSFIDKHKHKPLAQPEEDVFPAPLLIPTSVSVKLNGPVQQNADSDATTATGADHPSSPVTDIPDPDQEETQDPAPHLTAL